MACLITFSALKVKRVRANRPRNEINFRLEAKCKKKWVNWARHKISYNLLWCHHRSKYFVSILDTVFPASLLAPRIVLVVIRDSTLCSYYFEITRFQWRSAGGWPGAMTFLKDGLIVEYKCSYIWILLGYTTLIYYWLFVKQLNISTIFLLTQIEQYSIPNVSFSRDLLWT